jgi:hypothetical protein
VKIPTLPAHPTMPAVIAALREVGEQLEPGDGFRHFNSMYLLVTEGVAARVAAGEAHDADFLVQLDAVFCQLYFNALAALPDDAPRAWRPMLQRRRHRGISGLRYAIAGMNAHINRDLAVALDHATQRVGGTLFDDEPRHLDFQAVDVLLGRLMARTKDIVQDPLEELLDDSLGTVDDVIEHWSITHARAVAWENGQHLIRLRDQPSAQEKFVRGIDRTAGLIGRLLLL